MMFSSLRCTLQSPLTVTLNLQFTGTSQVRFNTSCIINLNISAVTKELNSFWYKDIDKQIGVYRNYQDSLSVWGTKSL